MRDHGESPKTSTMNHENNVRDLENFLNKLNQPCVLIGHSLGGTAAIDLAFKQPHLVKDLIMIDISPLRYPESEEEYGALVCKNLKVMLLKLPKELSLFKARTILENEMHKSVKCSSLVKIVSSNLIKKEEGWKWNVGIDVLQKLSEVKAMKNVYPIRGSYDGKCLLIHSDTSQYVIPKYDYEMLKTLFPKIKITCFKNCSHWIHVEKRNELIYEIVQHLNHH
ncbi:sn-1-specific diacylglycerol lipase ABHD11-like [Centruroides vittatus]|uniref:sn-1-specific diacylglycerol lipase ABHD11-like n=1 Tax=Centruroides vittatus TaxID=120091 RepID=UPI003510C847